MAKLLEKAQLHGRENAMIFEAAAHGDKDGQLNYDEFAEMVRLRVGSRKEETVRKWFAALDSDGKPPRACRPAAAASTRYDAHAITPPLKRRRSAVRPGAKARASFFSPLLFARFFFFCARTCLKVFQ